MMKKNGSIKLLPSRDDGSSAPPRRLGTVREACTYGRFSHTKCYDCIREGRIIAFKRDGRTLSASRDSLSAGSQARLPLAD